MVVTACNSGQAAYRAALIAESSPASRLGRVQIAWIGTAGIVVRDDRTTLVVDPFVSRNNAGMVRVALGRDLASNQQAVAEWVDRLGLQKAAAILVSHSHYDHSIDAANFARRTGGLLIGSESTLNIGYGAGLTAANMRLVKRGERLSFGAFSVTFFASKHGRALLGRVPYPGQITEPLRIPAPASAFKLGEAYSILIEHPNGRLLHHASAGWVNGALDGVRADVVLLGIAGRPDSGSYLSHVVDKVGASVVIPIHFDHFFRPLDEPMQMLPLVDFREFAASVQDHRPILKLKTLPVGEFRVLF